MSATELLARYKTIKSFEGDYDLRRNAALFRNQRECINAASPTLEDLIESYGAKVKVWIQTQIDFLQLIAGCRDKLLAEQYVMLIEVFLSKPKVKATMLLNFFHRLMSGCYGRFYGSVDVMMISSSWQDYVESCNEIYLTQVKEEKRKEQERIEEEIAKKQQQAKDNSISYAELQKIAKQHGHELPSLAEVVSKVKI